MIDPARRGAAITAPPGSRDGEDNARIADMFDAVRHENRRDPAILAYPRSKDRTFNHSNSRQNTISLTESPLP
jgi:hypothetical protein